MKQTISRGRIIKALPAILLTLSAGCQSCSGAGHPDAGDQIAIMRTDSIISRNLEACGHGISGTEPAGFASAIRAMAATGLLADTTATAVDGYATSRAFSFFAPDVQARFTCGDSLSGVLSAMRDNAARELPSMHFPAIYGVISPFNQAVMTIDSVALVALNHYLGSDYKAYSYFEPYIRRQKEARLLPYQLAEAMIERDYPMISDSTATALNHILHDGAVAVAMMRIVPDADPADIGGWTPDEAEWLAANEAAVWKELQSRGLLHSMDRMDISRLLNPAPATMALNANAPGRAGRYIGYRIVSAYLRNHPQTTLEELLRPEFFNNPRVLPESGYDGK